MLIYIFLIFWIFSQSLLFSYIVATPYEKALDTAKDVLDSTDQIYICRGKS